LIILTSNILFAQKNITITVKENQTIRSIADEYLGDSNLWEDILRANKLSSPADIKKGLKLVIPIASIQKNQDALNSAITAISEASKSGAKLFAEDLIVKSNSLYEEAITKRKNGNIEESTILAFKAKEEADKAIVESQNKSNTSGTALISYKKGDVENKKPSELIWNEAELYSKLFEQYRTRTLSNSYAEISFKDLSKIRLYENSQAVIQSSRVDLLQNRRRASVNLEKGEAYALLLGNGKKKDFNLTIPGLDTKIDSKLFWVQKENKETKIANYNGEISVTANDSMVVIKENQGSVVPDDGVPSKPKSLLPAPGLFQPEFEKTFYLPDVDFKWSATAGAEKYFFMVSGDKSFESIIESNKELKTTDYKVKNLAAGIYYWRVAAIDEIGFPGPFSQIGFFIIKEDRTPPYLIVDSPVDNFITKEKNILFSGLTETGISLFINGENLFTDSTGRFEKNYSLSEGFNKISIKAVDLGNNETVIQKNIIYESNPDVEIKLSNKNLTDNNNIIISHQKSITIYGSTRSNSLIKVYSNEGIGILKTTADENGKFEFLLSNLNKGNNYKILVETPAGYKGEMVFGINVISSEPEINLNFIPLSTSEDTVVVSGTIENTDEFLINNKIVTVEENNFSYSAALNNGVNKILFEAKNNSGYSTIIEKNILLDTDPPVLMSKKIKIELDGSFEILKISVEANDKSELKRTAQVNYELNGEPLKAYLRLDGKSNHYEGNIQILKSQNNKYKINSILLEDYLGNSKSYKF